MPDPIVLTIACGALAIGLAILIDALLIARAPFRPRCRACGADARGAIWRAGATCTGCGKGLLGRSSIRWGYAWARGVHGGRVVAKQQWAIGALIVLAATGVASTDRWLAQRHLQWVDLLPARWLIPALVMHHPGRDDAAESLKRRVRGGILGERDAFAALRTILQQPDTARHDWEYLTAVVWDRAAIEEWLYAHALEAVTLKRDASIVNGVGLSAPGLGDSFNSPSWRWTTCGVAADALAASIDGADVTLIRADLPYQEAWMKPYIVDAEHWQAVGSQHVVRVRWTIGLWGAGRALNEELPDGDSPLLRLDRAEELGLPVARVSFQAIETIRWVVDRNGQLACDVIHRELERETP